MQNPEEPKNLLLAGVRVLDDVLVPFGFAFTLEAQGQSSGGWFASGSYRRADRRLELHFRWSLGLVRYHIRQASLDHESYMRFLGVFGENRYPDFPKGPIEPFVHLASDISKYCSDFLDGDGTSFASWAEQLKNNPGRFKGIGGLG